MLKFTQKAAELIKPGMTIEAKNAWGDYVQIQLVMLNTVPYENYYYRWMITRSDLQNILVKDGAYGDVVIFEGPLNEEMIEKTIKASGLSVEDARVLESGVYGVALFENEEIQRVYVGDLIRITHTTDLFEHVLDARLVCTASMKAMLICEPSYNRYRNDVYGLHLDGFRHYVTIKEIKNVLQWADGKYNIELIKD